MSIVDRRRFASILCLIVHVSSWKNTWSFTVERRNVPNVGALRDDGVRELRASIASSSSSSSSRSVESATAVDVEGRFKNINLMTTLPRHASNDEVNRILDRTEELLEKIHSDRLCDEDEDDDLRDDGEGDLESVYANSYVDLGRIHTVGFDFDYTLVTYTRDLQELIYDMALERLVSNKHYPTEMISNDSMKFDPKFSIRGLAVDRDNAWICHLSYTHKVAVAWDGRKKLGRQELTEEYSGKRSLKPSIRKKRLKPLNDLFSMAECCLIADTVQFLKDSGIPFCRRSVVNDVLSVIGQTHISGDFHRMVAETPGKYIEPSPHLGSVIKSLKESGKKLIFVSNSPFWYVDAGMNYFFGSDWQAAWDAVIVSAGKPNFYTEDARPFREVSKKTGRIKFKKNRQAGAW